MHKNAMTNINSAIQKSNNSLLRTAGKPAGFIGTDAILGNHRPEMVGRSPTLQL
jgi:hypothetical protein